MIPESIPHFAIGPFFGLATNVSMSMLCAVSLALYRRYYPLKWLFFFYLFLTFFFLGWVIYALQQSPGSILTGYKICQASLALLPASWALFTLSLSNSKADKLSWIVIGTSLALALLSLWGKTPWLFGLPLEAHPVYADILRPQSKLLRPIIHLFCMVACLYYFLDTIIRLWRLKNRQPSYLVPFGIGLFLWFLGGLNDGFLTLGVIFFTSEKILWFASFWLSMFLTVAVVLHFRSLELSVREELRRLSHAKDRTINHLSHELKTPLAVMGGTIHIIKRKMDSRSSSDHWGGLFNALERMERQLNRLAEIQEEGENIIESYRKLYKGLDHEEIQALSSLKIIPLTPLLNQVLRKIRNRSNHRNVIFGMQAEKDLLVQTDPEILKEILEGILKNAVENTPDGGSVSIAVEPKGTDVLITIQDSGVGITEYNLKHIFDGLHPNQDTDFYASRIPYDFNAGGKGLDLLMIKLYGQHYGFEVSAQSKRCVYLPTDKDICPGNIDSCIYCRTPENCLENGNSTFRILFPTASSNN